MLAPFLISHSSVKYCLVLDSLRTHQTVDVTAALRELGLPVLFIPGGLTGHYQPMDVGINKPLKHWMREENARSRELSGNTPTEARKRTAELVLHCWEMLSNDTINNAFNHMLIRSLDEDDVTEIQLASEIN